MLGETPGSNLGRVTFILTRDSKFSTGIALGEKRGVNIQSQIVIIAIVNDEFIVSGVRFFSITSRTANVKSWQIAYQYHTSTLIEVLGSTGTST